MQKIIMETSYVKVPTDIIMKKPSKVRININGILFFMESEKTPRNGDRKNTSIIDTVNVYPTVASFPPIGPVTQSGKTKPTTPEKNSVLDIS